MLATFGIGMWANLVQILVLRLLIGTFQGTELIVSVVLAAWLLGVALGGALAVRWCPSLSGLNMIAIVAVPAVAVIFTLCGQRLPMLQGGSIPVGWLFVLAVGASLPVTLVIGMTLPAAARIVPVGRAYAAEAAGGCVGGLLFAFLLAGRVSSFSLGAVLMVPVAAGALLLAPRCRAWWWVVLAAPGLAMVLQHHAELLPERIWRWTHSQYDLVWSRETPYQLLQVGSYYDQKSLFLDNSLAGSWPDAVSGEETAHLFASGLATPGKMLLLGAPTPDVVNELRRYPGAAVTVVELDQDLLDLIASEAAGGLLRDLSPGDARGPPIGGDPDLEPGTHQGRAAAAGSATADPDPSGWLDRRMTDTVPGVIWTSADPRSFLLATDQQFDGILVVPSDPTTLLANRLFTVEAFAAMRRCLAPGGMVSVAVTGNENYLGPEMARVLHSTHRTLRAVFPRVVAVAGYPIVFWAGDEHSALATDARVLAARFRERRVSTTSFSEFSFANRLEPFRQMELARWLAATEAVPLNRDAHPTAFVYQLRLWDVFSGSGFRRWLDMSLGRWLAIIGAALLVSWAAVLAWPASQDDRRVRVGVLVIGWTGASGMVASLVLLFAYQTGHGAMFQMAALFFGLYMLGLTAGSWVVQAAPSGAVGRGLAWLKLAQAALYAVLAGSFLLGAGQHLTVLGAAVFSVAGLAGAEFAVVAEVLVATAGTASTGGRRVAAWLFWGDHLGAFLAALVAAPVLLPGFGLIGSMLLLTGITVANLVVVRRYWTAA